MKPKLIFINCDNEGMVQMTRDDLERLVDQAYQAGRADSEPINTRPWTITPTWADGAPTWTDKTTVTCNTEGTR